MTDEQKQAHDQGSTHTYKAAEEAQGQVINWDVNKAAIAEVAEDLKDIDAYKDLDAAKAAKKTLTKMRTALGEAHKETKAEALNFGRKVDAKKNEYLALIKVIEDPISEQLDEIKNKAAREEEERLQKIMDYIEGIQAFALDRHSLTLEELVARREELHSRGIDPEVTQERHDDAQLSYDEADLKLRLAIQNEKDRIEQEEAQRMAAEENAAKQKELDERQAKMDAEDAKRKAEQKERDEAASFRAAKEQAERQAEFDKVAAEQEAERKQLDEARVKREAEEAEEERLNLEAENEARAREQAPDREKLMFFAALVDQLLAAKPTLATDTANEIMLQAASMLIEVAYDIRKMTEEMK